MNQFYVKTKYDDRQNIRARHSRIHINRSRIVWYLLNGHIPTIQWTRSVDGIHITGPNWVWFEGEISVVVRYHHHCPSFIYWIQILAGASTQNDSLALGKDAMLSEILNLCWSEVDGFVCRGNICSSCIASSFPWWRWTESYYLSCHADEGSWPCYYLYTSSSSPYFQISNLDTTSKDEETMWRFRRFDPSAHHPPPCCSHLLLWMVVALVIVVLSPNWLFSLKFDLTDLFTFSYRAFSLSFLLLLLIILRL